MMCMYKHPTCINKLYTNYLLGCCHRTLLTITHVIGILLPQAPRSCCSCISKSCANPSAVVDARFGGWQLCEKEGVSPPCHWWRIGHLKGWSLIEKRMSGSKKWVSFFPNLSNCQYLDSHADAVSLASFKVDENWCCWKQCNPAGADWEFMNVCNAFKGFMHPRWRRISVINSVYIGAPVHKTTHHLVTPRCAVHFWWLVVSPGSCQKHGKLLWKSKTTVWGHDITTNDIDNNIIFHQVANLEISPFFHALGPSWVRGWLTDPAKSWTRTSSDISGFNPVWGQAIHNDICLQKTWDAPTLPDNRKW